MASTHSSSNCSTSRPIHRKTNERSNCRHNNSIFISFKSCCEIKPYLFVVVKSCFAIVFLAGCQSHHQQKKNCEVVVCIFSAPGSHRKSRRCRVPLAFALSSSARWRCQMAKGPQLSQPSRLVPACVACEIFLRRMQDTLSPVVTRPAESGAQVLRPGPGFFHPWNERGEERTEKLQCS